MAPSQFLDMLPLWGVLLVTVLIFLLAIEVGYRLGKLWQRRTHAEKKGPLDVITGGTLALLVFLLAFVTSMAVSRFDVRRGLVVDEANAIGTTYLRAGYLDEPYRTDSRNLSREYVDSRLDGLNPAKLAGALARSEQIHNELWSQAEAVARNSPQSPVVAIYIQSLNEVIDLHTKRVTAGLHSRVPEGVWFDVYDLAILAMVLVGMRSSYGERRNWLGLLALVLVVSAVLLPIVDLDRPQEGLLRVSQQALLGLQRQLRIP
jgi:hypothetical protein